MKSTDFMGLIPAVAGRAKGKNKGFAIGLLPGLLYRNKKEKEEASKQVAEQMKTSDVGVGRASSAGKMMRKGGKVKSKSYKHGGKLGCGAAIKGYGKGPYKKKGM
jgi:hypothetical protein